MINKQLTVVILIILITSIYSRIISSSAGAKLSSRTKNGLNEESRLKSTMERISNGFRTFIPNFVEAKRINDKKDKEGVSSLRFSEFQCLERAWEDVFKLGRIILYYPLSPEFFMYIYVVTPIFSSLVSPSPWAWASLPSAFDTAKDKANRISTLASRRLQSLVFALHQLKNDCHADNGSSEKKKETESHLSRIQKALGAHTFNEALDALQPYYTSDQPTNSLTTTLKVSNVPGAIIKEWCNGFGINGVPNIPLIRKINNKELSDHLDKIRKSDTFLSGINLFDMTKDELLEACRERCILAHEDRHEHMMRLDLKRWMENLNNRLLPRSIKAQPQTSTSTTKTQKSNKGNVGVTIQYVNPQNLRLTMMCLHTVREFRKSDFTDVYRIAATNARKLF